MNKTWFITGASRGFGKEFAKSALDRGDRVAATTRKESDIEDLVSQYGQAVLPLTLDVTDRQAVAAAVTETVDTFGSIDVVVNNAGYGLFGAVEEITEQQLRDQLEVNLFGVLHVTQAVLPILREQNSGHIIQISTIGGIAAFPTLGGYHASKWALEGLSESLAQEVAGFGVKVTLIEPGGYSTDWGGSSAVHAQPQAQYDQVRQAMYAASSTVIQGNPVAVGPAILKIVDADEPPLRVFFGEQPTLIAPHVYQQRLAEWEQWKQLSIEAQGTPAR
ncbi:SDR family oxidoreductase [Nocardia fluminea]|uniref:SDR family oxidoreductase n=1 Tax=Nocardia fluminea TaxID=134984 RepID=UPI003444983F